MLLTSWKSIRRICDNCSATTLRKWVKKYGMPIKWIDGKPTVTEEAIKRWWDELPTDVKGNVLESPESTPPPDF